MKEVHLIALKPTFGLLDFYSNFDINFDTSYLFESSDCFAKLFFLEPFETI